MLSRNYFDYICTMKHALKWLNIALKDREAEMVRLLSIDQGDRKLVDNTQIASKVADEIYEIKQEIKQLEGL